MEHLKCCCSIYGYSGNWIRFCPVLPFIPCYLLYYCSAGAAKAMKNIDKALYNKKILALNE
jgi:hypothetical protein